MAQVADEVDGSFAIINNVRGHQVADPYAAIDLSKLNNVKFQGENSQSYAYVISDNNFFE